VKDLLDPSFLLNAPLSPFLAMEAGRLDEAASGIDFLFSAVPSDGRGLLWLGAALPIVHTMSSLRHESAFEWYDALAAYSGCRFDAFLVDVELGRLCAGTGRWEEAVTHFDDATRLCNDQGLRPFLPQVHYHRALMLLARREGGDRREAATLLAQAGDLFAELDMAYMAGKVADVLAQPLRGRPLAPTVSGLTPRELMVLRLLADGKSNKDMAGDLFVTEKTVEHHLSSIYRKLGVSGRAAAISLALREQVI
jgi:ATP/maltotriose-dependent transcriptional regulator MalT